MNEGLCWLRTSVCTSRFGPRFFAMNNAYNKGLREMAQDTARDLGMIGVKEGVYTMMGGPNFETPAELRLLKTLGVDAVGKQHPGEKIKEVSSEIRQLFLILKGMSTIHEVLAARHAGVDVIAFSLITNVCITDDKLQVQTGGDLADEVFDTAKKNQARLQDFAIHLIGKIGRRYISNGNGVGHAY